MAGTIDYRTRTTLVPRPPVKPAPWWTVALAVLLTLWVGGVALRVEVLNRQVKPASRMPRAEEGKWRSSLFHNEAVWRGHSMGGSTRPMTPAERASFQADADESNANNALLRLVLGPGLGQYVLAPLVWLWGAVWMRRDVRRDRVFGAVMLTVGTLALVHALYCGYFTSLGL